MNDAPRDRRCERCRNKHTVRPYQGVLLCWQCYSLAQLTLYNVICLCGRQKALGDFYCPVCLHREVAAS